MRKIRLAVFTASLFLFSGLLPAQITMVRATSCGPATFPGSSCTIPATASGNLIVVAVQMGSGAVSGITDNAGNAYSAIASARSINTDIGTVDEIWYAKNSRPSATSISLTLSTTLSNVGVVIWEFSGIDPIAPLDQASALNSQASTTLVSGAPVTISSAGLIISHAHVANSVTGIRSGNAFINDSTLKSDGWAHLIALSPGTYFAQWNQSPAGSYASGTASFKAASVGTINSCDLNQDGSTNMVDVQLSANMALGLAPCTANIYSPGVCNVVVVQRVVNASLGSACVTGTGTGPVSHSVTLNWTASNSANVTGYNVYRSSTSGGPYTKLNSSLVAAMTYVDSTVQAGQTYYYVGTAVDSSNTESAYSSQATAAVPTP